MKPSSNDSNSDLAITQLAIQQKKRIAVLSSPTAWHYLDLKRACRSDESIFSFRFEELAGSINESQSEFNLDADVVIVRTMPAGSLQQIVFRMDLLAQLEKSETIVLNPAKSIEAAVDKYLSLAKLSDAGVAVPSTFVSQTIDAAMKHFENLGGDVVVKPIFGSMGYGIQRLSSAADAESVFASLVESGEVIYQQELIPHDGFDVRLFVIGDQVFSMKRTNNESWITNISQGAVGSPHDSSSIERELAIKSARALGAHFAGVDLMYDNRTGKPVVLEVNAVPGWQAISRVLEIDFARLILDEIDRLRATKV
ncbi:MAG: RimK family alpha-L-glutamate ligase [Mariniblastus sp.]